jgi:hypothetical protein
VNGEQYRKTKINNMADVFKNEEVPDFDPADQIDLELSMIRATLMLNPENRNLSSDELDRLVLQEFKDSQD